MTDSADLSGIGGNDLTGTFVGPPAESGPVLWSDILNIPQTASRWPTWAEITGKPPHALRWPTWGEVTEKPDFDNLYITQENSPLGKSCGQGEAVKGISASGDLVCTTSGSPPPEKPEELPWWKQAMIISMDVPDA